MSLGSNILIEDLAKMRIENKALRDEVARLRGALQDIHDSIGNGALNVEWIKRFAQAALTQGKGGGNE